MNGFFVPDPIKEQRDQFLAFAFASADLFFEVSHEGKITFATGAAKGLTGIDHEKLSGINWLELFSPAEQATIQNAMQTAKIGLRRGPMVVKLGHKYGDRKAIVTGIKMPYSASYFMTLGFSNALIEDIANKTSATDIQTILRRHDFIMSSQNVVRSLVDEGGQTFISFIHVKNYHDHTKTLGPGSQKLLTDALDQTCLIHSINGQNAGKFADDVYALIHNDAVTVEGAQEHLHKAATNTLKDTTPLEFHVVRILADLNSMDKAKTINAISYAIEDFVEHKDVAYDTLSGALEAFQNILPNKIKIFESYIQRVSFNFNFHQVMEVNKPDVDHFEILAAFEDGGHVQSWITFAEQHDLIAPFDLAILERSINLIKFKDGMTNKKYAMNISALSLKDPEFCEKFIEQLEHNQDINARLIIEFNATDQIEDYAAFYTFIETIHTLGFAMILDDVRLDTPILDTEKIAYFRFIKIKAAHSDRIIAAFKEKLAAHEKTDILIKAVENENRFDRLKKLNLNYMQGYYFGHPTPKAQLDNTP
jgi:EAL domain-containing protein (putative c-di-GMP-specific phosphodiesterase class I)